MVQVSLFFVLIALVASIFYIVWSRNSTKNNWILPQKLFPNDYKKILSDKVNFYTNLDAIGQKQFESRVHEFLLNHRITGVECDVSITDNLLVAASAIIPVFKFPEWRYTNLYDVLLYPDHFNAHHEVTGKNRSILGMVGTGYMEGKMILSKPALHHGFKNESDKKNTAIHEFVHLIDKIDGQIDGIPEILMEKQYTIPWIALMEKKIQEIYKNKSDINPYGGTSRIEFFAVVSEYFFERPKLLATKHPELYKILCEVFNHNMKNVDLKRSKPSISRNQICPCDSGKKFKACCGKSHC